MNHIHTFFVIIPLSLNTFFYSHNIFKCFPITSIYALDYTTLRLLPVLDLSISLGGFVQYWMG